MQGPAKDYRGPVAAWGEDFPAERPEEAAPEDRLEAALAWTAHEMRGPVLAARAALDRVSGTGPLTPQDRRLLTRSRDLLGQLAAQIDTVLRWAAGVRRLRPRRIDLGKLVRGVADQAVLPADQERVSVLIEAGVTVRADAPLLRAAVADVVRNALEYSPPDSPVSVRVQERGDSVRIAVRDRGPGVSVDERQSLFEPFVRGRNAPRAGTGLGLFIARRVVEAHGGEVWLESKNGGGTTVVLQLPSEGAAK